MLVTGAASGVGRAVAECLAARGGRVIGGDVDAAGLAQLPKSVRTVSLDVTSDASVDECVRVVEAQRCGLDAVVHCAGLFDGGPLVEIDAARLERMFAVHVAGVHRVNRAFFERFLCPSSGRIVHVSSEAARLAMPFTGPYTVSKFALEAYSDALRRELAALGVRVLVVQLGAVRTPLLEHTRRRYAEARAGSAFVGPLGVLARVLEGEIEGAMPPEEVAVRICRLLEAARPPARVRIERLRARRALEWLPSAMTDAAISSWIRAASKGK